MSPMETTGRPAAWPDTYGEDAKPRMGFFTDTSICIGCKACEVACKEWNLLPMRELAWTGESYDNTSALGAETWRHVAFVEQRKPLRLDGESAGVDGAVDAEGKELPAFVKRVREEAYAKKAAGPQTTEPAEERAT